jgi:hypothetical protein
MYGECDSKSADLDLDFEALARREEAGIALVSWKPCYKA